MKEVTAIIRMNKIGKTKETLLKAGFSSFTCRKVVGRGKKKVDFSLFSEVEIEGTGLNSGIAEEISELHRLIPKRMVTIVAKDEDAKKIVDIIIDANRTNNAGDGKIFVTDILEAIRIRTAEEGVEAL